MDIEDMMVDRDMSYDEARDVLTDASESDEDRYERHRERLSDFAEQEREERGGYTTQERMNDYVGPGIFANVTWERACPERPKHVLGLLSHECLACRDEPTIVYVKP